jgi:TRAP transporter TAXI family solute receptor
MKGGKETMKRMKTKVRFGFITVLLLVCGLVVSNGTAVAADVTRLAIGGASSGGTGYIVTSGVAKLIDQYVPNTYATVEATGGSVENARLVESGRCQFAIMMSNVAKYAYEAQKPFKKTHKNLRLMLIGQPSLLHFVVRADSGINSIADLRGKRVGVGAPGSSSAAFMVPAVLEAYGLSYDDINEHLIGMKETGAALADRSIVCGVFYTGVPSSTISELATTRAMKLLPVSDEIAKKILSKSPYFAVEPIPKGTYRRQTQDVLAVGNATSFAANVNLPEQVVYNIVKVLDEHMDEWKKVHPGARFYTPERTVVFGERAIPYHPGAKKYFKEKGILK